MAHKLGEPYSGKNPVPKITTKLTSLVNPGKATEAKAQQLQDRSGDQEPEQTACRLGKGHAMRTTDPTTGEQVDIHNADTEEDPDVRSKGDNVLRHEFPPPDLAKYRQVVVSVSSTSMLYICVAYSLCFFLAAFFFSSAYSILLSLLPPSILAYVLHFYMRNIADADFEDRAWHAERIRGMEAGADIDGDGQIEDEERTRESTEWLNAVLRGVWPIINPDMFAAGVDMLEDIMQSSAPAFVHSVRISDVGLGANAARVTSIRSLPDADGGSISKSLEVDSQDMSPEERDALGLDHVNLEISFAYRGLPSGDSAPSKAKNIHLLVEFFVGLRGVVAVRFPVWVEVTGAIGTARARLQLISDPPFVKTTVVTLLGLPQVSISVVPLSEKLPNVMNFPFVSGFISGAINAAAAEYVAPKSITVDLQKLISGDNIKKDTDTIGVLVVNIHRATGLESADANGKSDPYVTLTFSRLGKPLYSTRIIKADVNPVFEETAVILVDVNILKLREKLSFGLWDSDRVSVDDMLGYHEVEIIDLIRQRGKPIRRISTLSSPDSRHCPGSIEFTVGYYGKMLPNSSLSTDGVDPGIPDDLREKPEFKEARAVALNDIEAAVLKTPPDPEWPSGILSIQVHEIRDLAVRLGGKERKGRKERDGEKGQDGGEEVHEEAEGLPSSYCTISINDELAYETRVKPITSSPMFNAGTERFIRDWRRTHVTVAVKDSRMRENDAVLGVVFAKLSDIFVNASQVIRLYSLEEGVGHGRIRISLLFRHVEAKLPPNLLGFDTGTIEIRDVIAETEHDLHNCAVRMKTTTTPTEEKVSHKNAEKRDDGKILWSHEGASSIPVRQRYGTALLVSFSDTSVVTTSSQKAMAVLWLRDLVDHEEGTVEIALWQAKHGDYSRLTMNYVPPDGNLECWDSDKEKIERIGSVFLNVVFKPGISAQHYKLLKGASAKKRGAWDEYDRQEAAGMREGVGAVGEQTPPDHQPKASHETQMVDGYAQDTLHENKSMTNGPINSAGGDSAAVDDEDSRERTNTVVSTRNVEDEQKDEHHKDSSSNGDGREEDGYGSSDSGGRKTGPMAHFKEWRQHEKDLHRDHRGIMQAKPARTAQWMKDNMAEGVHAVKSRFKMHSRQPDVETEA